MNKSKVPKDYLYRKGSFEGWGQFFPHPFPPKIAPRVLKTAEIIEIKDTRGHFEFLHQYARFSLGLEVRITLLDFQNLI